MKRFKLFLSALMVLAATTVALAQNIKVSGVVVDQDGQPVPGATVQVEGTSAGSLTANNGQFSITAPSDGSLVVSFLGYETRTVAIGGKTSLTIVLKEDSRFIEEAVIVGYGSAKKPGQIVGSVTTVKSESIENTPSSSALDKLQGQVAGLAVMTTGGVAGDGAISMQLHGMGSLGSSSTPLYLIDGIPVSARTIMALNPNDIASISVNKDASATSIYGTRAANGVIYITTKSGNFNSDATVTVRAQAGVSTLANLSLYKNMMSGDELKSFWVRSGLHTPKYIREAYTDKGYTANTEWYKIQQRMITPQYQSDVAIEGGGNKVAYMIGISQHHEEGTTIGNAYDRYTVRANVQGRPKDWLRVGANMNLYMDSYTRNPYWSSVNGGVTEGRYGDGGLCYTMNPLYPAYDENGELFKYTYPNGDWNHYTLVENYWYNWNQYGGTASMYAEIEPIKNLKIRSQAGVDGDFRLVYRTLMPSYTLLNSNTGLRQRNTIFEYSAQVTNTAEYSFNIADIHEISILAGQEAIQNVYDSYSARSSGMTDDRLVLLQSGTAASRSVSESYTESRFLSFFGHLDYAIAGKYLFDATVRNDACSRFGKNVRNATFWSAGAKWRAKKEGFLADSKAITDLNLKVSYGTQGNAAGLSDYASLALVGQATAYADNTNSMIVSSPANPALTWEQQALFTIGFEGRLFDKLNFDIQLYNRQTSSMLMDVPYPYTSGFTSITDNVGGLNNKGIDITLGYDFLRGRDYYLRADATFNYNKETVTELFQGLDRWEMTNAGLAYVVGSPVMFYAPIYAGVDPADGRNMWYLPGDNVDVPTMDPNRVTKDYDEAALNQNTGLKYTAPIWGGFSISGGYKGFSAKADFSYVLGKTLINNDAYFYANPFNNPDNNSIKDVTDFWTPDNPNAKYPDWSKGEVMQFDTHLYEDASFMRLKNLQIGYDISSLMKKQKLFKSLKVTFTGRNLFIVTNYSGIDPEVDSNVVAGLPGNTRQFLGGLEIKF